MISRLRTILVLAVASCGDDGSVAPESLAPRAPEGFLTSARTAEIILTWKDVANETRYQVEYRTGQESAWQLLIQTGADVTTFKHTPVEHNVQYRYRIAACNASGCSTWIETGGKWDTGAPPVLSGITVTGIADNRATFAARGYTGGLTTRVVFTLRKTGQTNPVFVSEPITAFDLPGEGELGRAFTATMNYNNLEPATEYELSARASNTVGTAPPINAMTFRSPSQTASVMP